MRRLSFRELCDRQVRQVVPYSDWQLYKTAWRSGEVYRTFLLRHGRRFIRKAACYASIRGVLKPQFRKERV